MNGLKETCKCGHDKATHFRDPRTGEYLTCLGLQCDTCKRYRDPSEPKTIPPRPYGHPYTCRCFGCVHARG